MIYLSIAIIVVACIAGYLVNKYLDMKYTINTHASIDALLVAIDEKNKLFDSRINKAFETIQLTKTELESLRLQVGLKGIR